MSKEAITNQIWLATGYDTDGKTVVNRKFAAKSHPVARDVALEWAGQNNLSLIGLTEIIGTRMDTYMRVVLRLFEEQQLAASR